MHFRGDVFGELNTFCGPATLLESDYSVCQAKGFVINIRTANEKNGDKYWFDVTPSYYEQNAVDFFVFACGSYKHVYIFPTADLQRLIQNASLGGCKQVPNFTIYLDKHQFEPAGRAGNCHNVLRYYNAFSLVS